jgi:2-C-methyl-D-erythritol 4-phosphate cytidylyltransferase
MEKTEGLNKNTIAIITSAGWGARMAGDRPKQFLLLDDRPILAVTLSHFQGSPSIDGIILVAPEKEIEYCRREVVEPYNLNKVIKIIKGGQRRQDSVRLGLEASEGIYQIVVIHDGVRPFINPALIERAVTETRKHRAVINALPAKETIKEVDREGFVLRTHNRENIWLVQTPQAFYFKDIMAAHQKAEKENWDHITDDALLLERMGMRVKVIQGSEQNIKITTPYDLELARYIMKTQNKA